MKLLNFTIIKLTLCLVLGIIIEYFLRVSLPFILLPTIILGMGIIVVFLLAKIHLDPMHIIHRIFGVLALTLMFFIGMLLVKYHNEKEHSTHYTHYIKNKSETFIQFRISEQLKDNRYYKRYMAKVLRVNEQTSCGTIMVHLKKDTLGVNLPVDGVFLCKSTIKPIKPPQNPGQFNYKKFLENKYIYHQIIESPQYIITVNNNSNTLFGYADRIRKHINKTLNQYDFNTEQLGVVNALLLGQRQEISSGIYHNYKNAGVVHILAVSGLHIGIILMFLNVLFKPLAFFKYGKLLGPILIVVLLWSFAIIAGLSASITRAVTMFSIVAIASSLKRPTSIYNTLVSSMFVLLLFKPLFLFDIGFQLSYIAVFAIVSIQPYLYSLWSSKFWLIDKFWQITTVTLAAQIGVFPISLFYFHQFPGLFLISNLVIIPLLGFVLIFGFVIIFLAGFNLLPKFIVSLYGFIIDGMNGFIEWVAGFNQFVFKDLSFNAIHLLFTYVIIVFLLYIFKTKSTKSLLLFLLTIVIIQGVLLYDKFNYKNPKLVVFHKNRFTCIGVQNNKQIIVHQNLDSVTLRKDVTFRDYTIAENITLNLDTLKQVYVLKNTKLLVLNDYNPYGLKSLKPDIILLTNSTKINLNRLIDSLKPTTIVADGSNSRLLIKRWEKTCKKKKLPFHQTFEKGAFIIK